MDWEKSKDKWGDYRPGVVVDKTKVTGEIQARLGNLLNLLFAPINARQSPIQDNGYQEYKPKHPLDPQRTRPLMPVDSYLLNEVFNGKAFLPQDVRQSAPEHPDVLREEDVVSLMQRLRRHSTIYDDKSRFKRK